ncbi:MAG TPA: DNA-directed RNA polymerase subunit delta [Firmicutes bacterium]|uniref:DNA-directed RNA polymerase subunit delta n=1 Tax=Gelria sp. Kuro-4 TaxID=2796927 RepID=UPI0019CD86FE|nr:DNA-directed RNA polymerase subunit delta [Gelria sp. Kuro-4]BCV23992.1 hypothetical protein kuro4_07650 [Gelria sp. Kuro-4]HHV56253.1 DNA-directed RNA polymerase subunit delta [Bacillota bacterium]
MERAGKDKSVIQLTLDRCYALLKQSRAPMNFRELLSAGWQGAQPGRDLSQSDLATLYTSLNLDPRFTPMGKGSWGLAEWRPRSSHSSVPATSLLGKSYQDDRCRLNGRTEDQDLEEAASDTLGGDEEKGASLDEDEEWFSGDGDE